MVVFENLQRIILWGIVFGGLAYALFRWGKAGFAGLPSTSGLAELLSALLASLRNPLALGFYAIAGFLIWFFYSMQAG